MEKDIGKIGKNDQTDIVVRIDDFGGRKGLTIREFVSSEKYTGFTKAGVRIPAAEFINFREMINSIDLEDMKEEPGAADKKTAVKGKADLGKFSKPKKPKEEEEEESSEEESEENTMDY